MKSNLPRIKELFAKIKASSVWCNLHPQETNQALWETRALPTLERYYSELERLGVPRGFSEMLFGFGVDYLIAVRAWEADYVPVERPEGGVVVREEELAKYLKAPVSSKKQIASTPGASNGGQAELILDN